MKNFKEVRITVTVDVLMANSEKESKYMNLICCHISEYLKQNAIPNENLSVICEGAK